MFPAVTKEKMFCSLKRSTTFRYLLLTQKHHNAVNAHVGGRFGRLVDLSSSMCQEACMHALERSLPGRVSNNNLRFFISKPSNILEDPSAAGGVVGRQRKTTAAYHVHRRMEDELVQVRRIVGLLCVMTTW